MKKIVLLFLLALPLTVMAQKYIWFDDPGEVINEPSFQVFQVWSPTEALVRDKGNYTTLYGGTIYLIIDNNGNFYDDQIIRVPKGKEVRRVGTVRYPTPKETTKTVPVIQIMDRQKKIKKNKKNKV